MPIKAKYVHTNLMARDWRRLVDFYITVFGCVPQLPQRDISGEWIDRVTGLRNAHLHGMHLRLPGFEENAPTLEIFSYAEMTPGSRPVPNEPGFGHVAFAVEDVEIAVQAVRTAGGGLVGEVATTTMAGVGILQAAYAHDPEGNIIELQRWS